MKLLVGTLIDIPVKNPLSTYKKLHASLKSPVYNYQYKLGHIHHVKDFDTDVTHVATKRFYSFLLKYVKEHEYLGDYKIFQCDVWGKVILEPTGQLGSEFIKITRELSLKEALPLMTSGEAYAYCTHVADIASVRDRIIEDKWILNYCNVVRDDPTLAKRIKDPQYKLWYNIDKKRNIV